MKVKILRNTVASGFHCSVGDTPELSDDDASKLVRMGKAEKFNATKKAAGSSKKAATGAAELLQP